MSARARLIRQKTEQFVNILFWHSIMMTMTTPLARLTRGRWASASFLYWGVIVFCWLFYWQMDVRVKKDSENPQIDESFVYKTERKTKGVDFAFGFHAFSGLFWLLTAWVQMSLLKTSKTLHRMFGVVAIISFSMHMVASLYNLYFDYMKHRPLPRLLLAMACMDSIICMVTAITQARRKDLAGHRDAMIRCFIYSIEGAGTIRTIASLQAFLGLGPTECQILWNGTATHCLYSYTWRLILTRYLSMSYLGLYTVHRNNKNFTRSFLLELLWFSLISVCLMNSRRMTAIDAILQLCPVLAAPAALATLALVRVVVARESRLG